eukprot:CAMPEP_0198126196 /NCGR_PEP_ID=MMETSP1442-20131203/44294_1 /TAXON_ID= /ORGANISM="Craspedostauros australis, Strain CCMP3328" /LENGTH=33 /DNA_ID= /DNA_START= /DNA_END= /DNA_ORIENTATION=
MYKLTLDSYDDLERNRQTSHDQAASRWMRAIRT